jgi:CheY-like chemotaxis protein
MPQQIQDRAFDPFFTTKEKGKGTGLGLSTCHGIVTGGGGHISISSEVDVGTTFNVFFPRVIAPAAPQAAKDESVNAIRGETILVVDDEDTVRSFAAEILCRLGYQVLCASSGMDALALASQPDQRIDLLLSDVEMPEMTGPELVEVMEYLVPDLKVLYISGFSSDPQLQEWAEARRAFLQKPFSSAQLSQKVWEVLSLPATDTGGTLSNHPHSAKNLNHVPPGVE